MKRLVTKDWIILDNQWNKKIMSLEDLMTYWEFNKELWDIISSDVNMRTTTMKMSDWETKQVENYQVKAKLKPISKLARPEIIEVLKKQLSSNIPTFSVWDSYGWKWNLANINHFDLHINRYQHNTKKYLKEIDDRTMRLFELLLRDKPDKLLYVNWWDYLNTDIKWLTTKWTQQLNSLKEQDAFWLWLEHQVKLIKTFASELPTDAYFIPWNHAIYSENYLAKAVDLFFSNTDWVNVESTDNPMKKYIWWDNALVMMHWDMIKDNQILPNLTTEWINKKYMYALKWDKHIRATKEIGNLLIDTYPSPADNCDWSKRNWWNKVWKIYWNIFNKKEWKTSEYAK